MKLFTFLSIFFFVVSCSQSNDTLPPENKSPRIEFIECRTSPPDFSLERKVYFNKEVTIVGDTTTISFDFMKDCCLQFDGKWQIVDEVLTLSYHPKDEIQEPCECKCAYSMNYHFNNQEFTWKTVRIKRGK